MKKIRQYLKLMRVKHYLKNFLVFLPLIFSGRILEFNSLIKIVIGFVSFSLIASVVYIINDIKDVEKDRNHPVKCKRPIASGNVVVKEAVILAVILAMLAFVINYFIRGLDISSYLILSIYLIINVFYSFGLKDKPIIDITILMAGFVLRVFYGAVIIDVQVSNWLYLTIISAAFYFGLSKRRNEMVKNVNGGGYGNSRKVLEFYTKDFLDKNMYICLALIIVFYSLWCVDPITISKVSNNLLIWTVPLVLIILMKYSLNIEGDSFGDPVDVVLEDKSLIILIFLYCLITGGIIYYNSIIEIITMLMGG